MLRKALWIVAALLGLLFVFVGTELAASESGEVLVLRTQDDGGHTRETRIWVADDAGAEWLRAGNEQVGWLVRLRARPDVEVVRKGVTRSMRATPVPEARDQINDAMHAKYGFADSYVCFFFARDKKIPVRLDPR